MRPFFIWLVLALALISMASATGTDESMIRMEGNDLVFDGEKYFGQYPSAYALITAWDGVWNDDARKRGDIIIRKLVVPKTVSLFRYPLPGAMSYLVEEQNGLWTVAHSWGGLCHER